MDFAIITPIAGLERYALLSKTHMVLTHIESRRYFDFYRQRVLAGDLVILDCSAYEGEELDIDHYTRHINELEPQVVVVPDLILQNWKVSMHYSLGLHQYLIRHLEAAYEFMYVPQAEENDPQGFASSLREALETGWFTWIGLPRALNSHIAKSIEARTLTARWIKENYPSIKVHALGYGGSVQELHELNSVGVLSIDSSAPVWRGWCGFQLGALWPDFPCDFNVKLRDNPYDKIILDNLEECNVNTQALRGENLRS